MHTNAWVPSGYGNEIATPPLPPLHTPLLPSLTSPRQLVLFRFQRGIPAIAPVGLGTGSASDISRGFLELFANPLPTIKRGRSVPFSLGRRGHVRIPYGRVRALPSSNHLRIDATRRAAVPIAASTERVISSEFVPPGRNDASHYCAKIPDEVDRDRKAINDRTCVI